MFGGHSKDALEQQLREQIHALNQQLEQLQQHQAGKLQEGYQQVRNRANELWLDSREQLREGYQQLQSCGQTAAQHARRCAREHPIATVAAGIGAGALLYWLLRR